MRAKLHQEVAAQWMKRRRYHQASFSLSRATVLAGVLQGDTAYTIMCNTSAHALTYMAPDYDGVHYIRLAQLRAAIARDDRDFLKYFEVSDIGIQRMHRHVRYGYDRFMLQIPDDMECWRLVKKKISDRIEQEDRELDAQDRRLFLDFARIRALQEKVGDPFVDLDEIAQCASALGKRIPLFQCVWDAVRNSSDFAPTLRSDLRLNLKKTLDVYPY